MLYPWCLTQKRREAHMTWRIEPVDEIEVFVTEGNDVAIKQTSYITDDHTIVVPLVHIDRVIRFLQEAASAAKEAAAEAEEFEETVG